MLPSNLESSSAAHGCIGEQVVKDYNEATFVKALEEAGFRRDRSVYQFGAQFMVKSIRKGMITVSLYPGHYTASVASGFMVRDLIPCSRDANDLISKAEGWEQGVYGTGVSANPIGF